MRSAAVFVAVVSIAGCGGVEGETSTPTVDGESKSLTEAEGAQMARGFAATDLVLVLDPIPTVQAIVVSGTVTNAGPSDSGDVRVRLSGGPGLTFPDPLDPNCVVDEDAVDCLVAGSLPVTMPGSNRPDEETARFEVIMPVDRQTLPVDENVVLSAVVTAENLDLDNDSDPSNNSVTITVAIPKG